MMQGALGIRGGGWVRGGLRMALPAAVGDVPLLSVKGKR